MSEVETVPADTKIQPDPEHVPTDYSAPDMSWKEFVPEDRRSEVENYKSLTDVLDAKKSFETAARTKATVPPPDATEEELKAFYEKLAPKDISEYKLELPEGQEPIAELDSIKALAKEAGIRVDQFSKVAPVINDLIQSTADKVADIYAPTKEKAMAELQEAWKDNTDTNIGIANKAFNEFGSPEDVKYLIDTGLANNPVIIRMFHSAGTRTLDDSLVKGEPVAEPKPSGPFGEAWNKRYGTPQ